MADVTESVMSRIEGGFKVEQPTAVLRWRGGKLQQKWFIITDVQVAKFRSEHDQAYEWRDVPAEDTE